jgi:hypothetical protein
VESADEAFDRDQTLRDRIDSEEKAFKRYGAEQRWAALRNQARCRDLDPIKHDAHFGQRPGFVTTAGRLDCARSERAKLETLGKAAGDNEERRSDVNQ